jgi:hypothetical protein
MRDDNHKDKQPISTISATAIIANGAYKDISSGDGGRPLRGGTIRWIHLTSELAWR